MDILTVSNGPDRIVWIPEASGAFSTRSAYESIRERQATPFGSSALFKQLWKTPVPLKFSFITLRAVKNRLPVDDRIQSIGIPLVSRCVCCLQPSAESASHLFLHGTWADSLWSHYQSIFGIDSVRTSLVNWLQVWFSYPHQSMVGCLRRMVPILIISQIWYARNDAVFDQGKFYLQARIRAIYRICLSLLIDRRSPKRERPANKRRLEDFGVQSFAEYEPRLMVVKWLLPPHCFFKLNTDGASRGNPGPAGGGGAGPFWLIDLCICMSSWCS